MAGHLANEDEIVFLVSSLLFLFFFEAFVPFNSDLLVSSEQGRQSVGRWQEIRCFHAYVLFSH
jgi:hypothetical protein